MSNPSGFRSTGSPSKEKKELVSLLLDMCVMDDSGRVHKVGFLKSYSAPFEVDESHGSFMRDKILVYDMG